MSIEQTVSGPSPRVLIIDDEVTIRIALRRFFTRMGWSVDEAVDGASALELLESNQTQRVATRYSLVVSDLRMPGVNGMEMYDRLKSAHPDVIRRLVFSTGDVVSEEAASFVRTTDCIVLQKPFELSTLRSVVEQVLASNAS